MKRVPLALTSLGSAALLGVALPASAEAATGVFRYTHAYSDLRVMLINPSDDACIPTTAFGDAANDTDRNVTLYPSPACQGEPLGTLVPNGKAAGMAFASVRFTAP